MRQLGDYAVVFSGGGALGAWEVGCMRELVAHHGGKLPRVMSGASAGSLNAAAFASGLSLDQVEKIQQQIASAKDQ